MQISRLLLVLYAALHVALECEVQIQRVAQRMMSFLKSVIKWSGSVARCLAAAALLTLWDTRLAFAQADADFFRGKNISLGIPSDVTGGYDTYVRLLGRYYQKHLPGNPNMVPQNIPGGGGLVLANLLYNTDRKDGTTIGMVRASVLYEGVFRNPAVKFDGRKFMWIGNLNNADRDTCVFWHTAGINSPADFYHKEVLIGATGNGAMSFSFPSVYNNVLGTHFKIVTGYKGTGARMIAMERGEVQGGCGLTTSAFRASAEQPYEEGKLKLVALTTHDPAYPNVPSMLDEAKTPEQRQALTFLFAQIELGRAMAAPPGTPQSRIDILRRGFDATMKDTEFLAEAAKLKLEISPMNSSEVSAVVERFYATPETVVQKVRAALSPKDR